MIGMLVDPDVINAIGGQVIAVLIALGTFVGVVLNAVLTIRGNKQVAEVKELANGNLTAERSRNQHLTELLSTTNVVIPDNTGESKNERYSGSDDVA